VPRTSTHENDSEVGLREYGLAELATAIDALVKRGGHVHAGVHQARKAIRRTRTMLRLGKAVLGPGGELIDSQLHRINCRLSPLRDAHALVQTLDRLGIKARDEATRVELDHARRIARRQRSSLSKDPEFSRTLRDARALLMTLQAALQGLPWRSLTPSVAAEAMALEKRQAEAPRQRAYKHDDAEDWHRWRRRMRRISQQHRAAAAAGLASPVSRFDKNLAEQLGVMQDLSLLIAHCEADSPFPKSIRVTLRRFAKHALARQRRRIRSVITHI
jgi:CHAD domain-containing protein